MRKVSIQHYQCFRSDKRLSMDIYANSLSQALDSLPSVDLTRFAPASSLERYSQNRLVMRYLRYRRYPQLVKHLSADLHHVLDHGYAHLLPSLGDGPKCVTAHDLIPLLQWKADLGIDGVAKGSRKPMLNLHSLSFLERYDGIVAVSESTKRDLVKYLELDPEKITVVAPPLLPQFKPLADDEIRQFALKYKLEPKYQWLMVSGREFYKNHKGSLNAVRQLVDNGHKNIRIVKTGAPSNEFSELVASLGLQDYVVELFLEDFSELPLLYNFIDCLIFPSFYEGFGMPVAEALACGTAVVASDRGALPEVMGGLGNLVEPNDHNAIANALSETLDSPSVRQRFAEEGPRLMKKFSLPAIAEQMESFYCSVAQS